jgi:predicted homoserine dehydrogenase-like protein
MILIDKALKAREETGRPIRVAMVGAGFMSLGIANQILNYSHGMRLVAVSNRRPEKALRLFAYAGVDAPSEVRNLSQLEENIRLGRHSYTEDAMLLCRAHGVDVVIDATGDVEFGAHVAMEAIRNRKHLLLMNAEVDGTIGSILNHHAEREGVLVSACDGDQPGVQMNLYRFVRSIGLTPLLCGNIKGLQDPYRTPLTQKGFAEKWGQNVNMVTSFADGTKVSFEQALVANGTGMTVAKRGLHAYDFLKDRVELLHRFKLDGFTGHIDELTRVYDMDELKRLGGIVEYVVAMQPAPGVFVLATHEDPRQRHYLNLYKLGEGPLYSFYTPYHLCHFEVPHSVARLVLFGDRVLHPEFGPRVDVVATAKRDLEAGQTIDGMGGFDTYGQCEKYRISLEEGLLPVGLAEGCRLLKPVRKDEVIRYEDVERPVGKLSYSLRMEQDRIFGGIPAVKAGEPVGG